MSSLVVDTNAVTALLQGKPAAAALFKEADRLYYPFIVIAEVYSGFRLGTKENKNRENLSKLFDNSNSEILYPDEITLDQYADIYVLLRKKGKPIPTNDIWIAALAMQHNLPLFTFDSHFHHIDQIKVVTTVEEFIG